jgi:SOS response regulatory protein OraA/RecX
LRRVGSGRVALEIDGVPWRIVPDEVVVRARLALGLVLDRPVLREIGRELRRANAVHRAGRMLARRDLSEAALRDRLERRGIAPANVGEAAEALRRVGALDDVRFARSRARSLGERGWGDEAILARLSAEGAPREAARDAVSQLAPESDRARPLVAGLAPPKAARLLARRGFAPDTVESVVQPLDVDAGAGLG